MNLHEDYKCVIAREHLLASCLRTKTKCITVLLLSLIACVTFQNITLALITIHVVCEHSPFGFTEGLLNLCLGLGAALSQHA